MHEELSSRRQQLLSGCDERRPAIPWRLSECVWDHQAFASVCLYVNAKGAAAMHLMDAVGFAAGVLCVFAQVDDAFLAGLLLPVEHAQYPGFEFVARRAADDDADFAIGQLDDFPWRVDADHADKAAHNLFVCKTVCSLPPLDSVPSLLF